MGSSGEHSDSAIPTGGPSMNVRLAFALLPLLFLGSPVYAQSPCSECLKAAEDVRSQLHQDASADSPFFLSVVHVDHETLLISVRYLPTVNREMMSSTIDSTRKVIMATAKSYGWENWVKIREQVEMSPLKK